jgi:hypothetical protein
MSAQMENVESKIQKIADHQEIVDVLHRFMAAQDSGDWDALARTITPNARVESARFGEQKGADAVIAVCKRALGHYDGIIHVMNNIRVEQKGDAAKVHYCAISYHLRRGVEGGETLTNRGTNTVDVVRTADGWKLDCYRSSKISWQEGNPKVRVNKSDPATHGG